MATTKRRWLVGGGIAVPLAVFAGVYLIFFTPDSPERLKLSANGAAAPAGAPSLAGEWKIAEGSVAGYRVREKLAQFPAPSDAVGRTTAITGGFTADKRGDKLAVKGVRFEAI